MKEHFSSPQWVDLVRGQLAAEAATEMDRHLRAGCDECTAAFDEWQGLKAFADEEKTLTPPAAAVRVAKTYLAEHHGRTDAAASGAPLPSWTTAVLATLTFDSAQMATAGVRAGAPPVRHLLFESQSLVVDLQLESDHGAGRLRLSGQVADRHRPGEPMKNVWMSLFANLENVRTFQTNEFGEFHCSCADRRPMKLVVYANSNVFAIPLETQLVPRTDTERLRGH